MYARMPKLVYKGQFILEGINCIVMQKHKKPISFESNRLLSSQLEKVIGGKRVYNGVVMDCDGKTEITWTNYNIFGQNTGIGSEKDQVTN